MKNMSEQLYRKLLPSERAQLAFKAAGRCDKRETDRLIRTIPEDDGFDHRRAYMGLCQAADAYVYLHGKAAERVAAAEAAYGMATSFCLGWLAAGGGHDGEEYRESLVESERTRSILAMACAQAAGFAVAFKEWCEEQGVEPETVLIPTGRTLGNVENPDPEAVEGMRSVLDAIRL